jgi:hypothetical protein
MSGRVTERPDRLAAIDDGRLIDIVPTREGGLGGFGIDLLVGREGVKAAALQVAEHVGGNVAHRAQFALVARLAQDTG